MTFELSAAALGAIAVGGATIVSGFMQSNAASKAAEIQGTAAEKGIAQQGVSSQAAIDEQRRQFDAVQKILQPFVAAGAPAVEQQQALLGLRGPEAERAAIERISGGEQFKALEQQGRQSLLSSASATGGLRGGNLQGALAQFSPALLSNLIEKQYGRLGGLAATGGTVAQNLATAGMGATGELARIGQASAAGVGSAGAAAGTNIGNIYSTQGTNIANLLGQQGQAQAGGEIGQANAFGKLLNLPAQILGFQYGAGKRPGFGF